MTACTAKAIRAYFVDGTLPEPGTICQPDFQIFDVDPNDVVDTFYIETRAHDDNDATSLTEAIRALRHSNFLLRSSLTR